MALWTWWRGDPLPILAPLSAFRVEVERDVDVLAPVTALEPAEVRARLDAGHRAFLARLGGAPVAYGWAATLAAAVGEHHR